MFCRKCGFDNSDDSVFCEGCGERFSGISNPGTSSPGTSRPGTSRPGTSRPGTSRPGVRVSDSGGGYPAGNGAKLGSIRPGTVVGGIYRIDSELGAGGMGVVYRGYQTSLDRQVAIKVLGSDLMRNAKLLDRFQDEAKLQARLLHPNIVAVHDFVFEEDLAAIVMEYVEGMDLAAMLEQIGVCTSYQAVIIVEQVLAALEFAHSHGIVHRDIKPSNVMMAQIGTDRVAKVMDFGLAKLLSSEKQRTATGTKMGTLWYMSPEQCRGAIRDIDHRSDLYSVGIMLYELLAGVVPFDGTSDFDIMRGHLELSPTPPQSFIPAMPVDVQNIILHAINKDPAQRFQSAQDFRAVLRDVAHRLAQTPNVCWATDGSSGPARAAGQMRAQAPSGAGYPNVARTVHEDPGYVAGSAQSALRPQAQRTVFEGQVPGQVAAGMGYAPTGQAGLMAEPDGPPPRGLALATGILNIIFSALALIVFALALSDMREDADDMVKLIAYLGIGLGLGNFILGILTCTGAAWSLVVAAIIYSFLALLGLVAVVGEGNDASALGLLLYLAMAILSFSGLRGAYAYEKWMQAQKSG